MKKLLPFALLALAFVLAACSATSTPLPADAQNRPVSTETALSSNTFATRIDQQGAVIIEVTPLNLDSAADTLKFDAAMNTHSIDLSMDLAKLATLTTDTGISVNATSWDAPSGGHHVEGKLIFPAMLDGKSVLAGATKLTLTIVNVDAPTRIFEWELK